MSDLCTHKHAVWNVPEEHWRCPKCGADLHGFFIEESVNEDCDLLHDGDFCRCTSCGYEASGGTVARVLLKRYQEANKGAHVVAAEAWAKKHGIAISSAAMDDLLKIIKPS